MINLELNKIYLNEANEPKIITIYGPSGSGKTLWKSFLCGELKINELVNIISLYPLDTRAEICKEILEVTMLFNKYFDVFSKILSFTTREPRINEMNMVHYNFKTVEEFEKDKADGLLLEYTNNFGNYYGTSKAEVYSALSKGKNVAAILDNVGIPKYKSEFGNKIVAIYINVDPATMEKRMRSRGDTEEVIAKRLSNLNEQNTLENGISDYILDSSDRIDKLFWDLFNILVKECMIKK